jgi:hypothetical protein
MKKYKTTKTSSEPNNDEIPSWVREHLPIRSTPYSEEELDLLVEGTVEGIRDTAAWKDLVRQVGQEEARRVLRSQMIMQDENAYKLTIH